ncbi:MAG: amidohydrolase family protein [Candidatus Hodarchaeota archaeon]
MIINVHSHLIHRNMWSEYFWDKNANIFSEAMNIPKDVLIKTLLPRIMNADAERYVEAMDNAGIDIGIVNGTDWGKSAAGEATWSVEEQNQWVKHQVDEYPDKLYGICAVDPRRGEEAIKLVEKAVNEWGMIGVKFHPTAGYYPDNPDFFPFYEKCLELKIPVFSHTSVFSVPLMEGKFADPIYLDSVAARFPNLKIVMLHFGGLPWVSKCVEIMNARHNVYTEISGWQSRAFFDTDHFLKLLFKMFTSASLLAPLKDRIMFGTDWPLLETAMEQKDWVEWIKNIPEKADEYGLKIKRSDIKKLLGLNAKKFLNL